MTFDVQAVIDRLQQIGVETDNTDEPKVQYLCGLVLTSINNAINENYVATSLPDGLVYVAIERTAGEYLAMLDALGTDEARAKLAALADGSGITQIREGDTSVSFDSKSTSASKVASVIDAMRNFGDASHGGDIYKYRKLRWNA